MHNGSDTPEVLNMHVVTREVFMADDSMVYIGRGSKWGNPFVIGADGTREEVIAQYRDWILTRDELLESLSSRAKIWFVIVHQSRATATS